MKDPVEYYVKCFLDGKRTCNEECAAFNTENNTKCELLETIEYIKIVYWHKANGFEAVK